MAINPLNLIDWLFESPDDIVRTARARIEAESRIECAFCGNSPAEVTKLIAGDGVYICDSCINICKTILDKQLADDRRNGIDTSPQGAHKGSQARHVADSRGTLSAQEIKERLALLRQLRDDETITKEDYQLRARELFDRI